MLAAEALRGARMRHFTLWLVLLLTACAADPGIWDEGSPSTDPAGSVQQSLSVHSSVRDTYIKAGKTPREGATTVWADNVTTTSRAHALLKFDLGGQSGTVSAVSLELDVSDSGSGFQIYELKRNFDAAADWNYYASGSPWATAGAGSTTHDRGSTVLGTVNCPTTGSCTTSLNTAGVGLIQSWVNAGKQTAGLILVGSSAENIGFTSSEGGKAPKLKVSYAPASVPALRDTYIKAGKTPRDTAATVWVDGITSSSMAHALLKFDLSGRSGTLSAASLELDVVDTGTGFEIYELKRNFDGAADWNHHASGAAWAVAGAGSTTHDRGSTVLGTVNCSALGPCDTSLSSAGVSLVQSWIDSGKSNAGLIIVGSAAQNLGFRSIEGGSAARPKLNLSFGGSSPPPPPPPAATLRVITFNVKKGGTSGELVDDQCQLMANHNPDVLLLQEVPNHSLPRNYMEYVTQMRTITGNSNWKHVFSGVHGGPMVMSRLPLQSQEVRAIGPSSFGGSRHGVRIGVNLGGHTVQVWNTHIDIEGTNWGCGHCQTNIDTLLAWVGESQFSGQRKVLGGDFNANLSSGSAQRYVIERILAHSFVDTSTEAYGSNSAVPATNGGWRPDHIFRSSSLSTNASQVVNNAGTSDHHMIVSEVAIQ
jgi:endonuclease/exonuclease/phosphatase family metal-dependent hydrolase